MSLWLSLHEAIHFLEELRVPYPSSKGVLLAGAVAVPVAVLIHDSSEWWLPKTFSLPVLSWFRREWRKDSKTKTQHLTLLRNVAIFVWAAAMLHENPDASRHYTLDYVADRVSSEAARKSVTASLHKARGTALQCAQEVALETGMNDTKVSHQLDAEIRRRYAKESRTLSVLH